MVSRAAEHTDLVNSIARQHGIKVEWRRPVDIPGNAVAFARPSSREVVLPHIQGSDEECDRLLAVALHEIGHCLSEKCQGGDHAPVRNGRAYACLRCEQLATAKAMELGPFTRGMFDRLAEGLGTYRRTTRGPRTAIDALDRQRGSLTFAEHRQDRVMRAIDVKQAQLDWARLTDQERLDRRVALQRAEMEQLRARRARRG